MNKITNEEISALVASQIKEMELNGIFSEDTLVQIQEKVSKRVGPEDKVLEEEASKEESEELNMSNKDLPENSISIDKDNPKVTKYEVELPDFIKKIDPAKFVIFDMNEVSLGGEQLSNKPFRLFSNPDEKKSIHETWKEEGKKTGEIYIAKFEKVGDVEFDYRNGTSHFTEKRFETSEEPGKVYQDNPYAEEATPQEVDNKPIETAIENAVDVEGQVKSYIEDVLRKHFSNPIEDTTTVVSAPIKAYDEIEIDEDPVQMIEPKESAIQESELKYKEIVMNERKYVKVDTPNELKESINSGKGNAKLIAQNDQVQTWVLEGVEYYLPSDIISDNKCHTKLI